MTESSFELRCPKCTTSIMANPDQAGETIQCPRCQNRLLIPGRKPASSDVSVDDLIDIDDDILTLIPDGMEMVADVVDEAADEAIPVAAIVDLSDDDDELKLSPDPDIPVAIPVENDAVAEAGSSEGETGDDDPELEDLLILPESTPTIIKGNDPLEADENANLVVDGVTPQDNQFPVVCNICGTLLYARVSQVGTQLKCPDCFSSVDVHPPRTEPKPVEHPVPVLDDEGGYTLTDPVELEPIDTTVDTTLGDIDYDDDDFFEKRREFLHRGNAEESDGDEPENLEVVDDDAVTADYELGPFPEDKTSSMSRPRFRTHPEPSPTPPKTSDENQDVAIHVIPEQQEPDAVNNETSTDELAPDTETSQTRPGAKRDAADLPGIFVDFGNWLKKCCSPLFQAECVIRMAVIALAIGAAYMLGFMGAGYMGEESTQIIQFVGFILFAFAGLLMIVALFFVGVMANPVIQVAMNQDGESLSEWPDFSLSDWFSKFIFMGTSFWLAAFPGVILGGFAALTFRSPIWLLTMIVVSSLMLTPFFLASVVLNETPWQPITANAFRSFTKLRNRWIRFLISAFVIGLLMAGLVVLASFSVLAFVAAALQLALLFIYFWMLGNLTEHVVKWMISKSES